MIYYDGQEAPPINPRYRTDFSSVKNKLNGLIVGVGGNQPVPIPKFNQHGEREGFYTAEDVPHRSSFGESDLNPEKIEGYDARNASFGSTEVTGAEHQSALNESYLLQLSAETGFDYLHLAETQNIFTKLEKTNHQIMKDAITDVRWQWAVFVLACILVMWI